MKYPCEMVKDLLPLYHDGVCSEPSRQIVEEHLKECKSCQSMLDRMEDHTFDARLQKECENVVDHYAHNVRKKSLSIGLCIASLLGIPILVCLIVNLATGHALDWFFIVLTSLMVLASITVVPLVVEEKKGLWTLAGFTGSLLLLLLTCCVYSKGNWFWVASVSILFGLTVIFMPFVLPQLPLQGFAAHNKGLIVMLADTVMLYLLILVCGLYGASPAYWRTSFLITTGSITLPWFMFLVIRYFKANICVKAGLCTIAGGIYLGLYNDIINWIIYGTFKLSLRKANLTIWNTNTIINANSYFLALMIGVAVGAILLIVGLLFGKKNQTKFK